MAKTIIDNSYNASSVGGGSGWYTFRTLVVENSTNPANNSSNITVTFSAKYNYSGTGFSGYTSPKATIKVDNVQKKQETVSSLDSSWKTIASWTGDITHNANGEKSITVLCTFEPNSTVSYLPGTNTTGGSGALTKIARYTNIKTFSVSKRNETSVTFNWSTADTIDYVWYSKDNGSTWTGLDVADGTSGSFNVGSLTPNTKYNFKLRVRRKDSRLTTDSSVVSQTTYKIPTHSLNQKNETSIKINWAIDSTSDRVQYSTDNGKTWSTAITVNATSGNYTISGLTPNTTYSIKTRVRRTASQTTYDTASLSVTTYKVPTQSLNQKTETSIVMNWVCDSTIDYLYYSKDGGSTWTGMTISDKTSGTYTISGLTANTNYNIKTRVRRKATQTTYDTTTLAVITYDYPHCIDSPNFKIGDKLTLKFYNPLGRTFKFYIISNGIQISNNWTISKTSYSGIDADSSQNQLYATIPNQKSATYQVKAVYENSVKTRSNNNTVSIKGTEIPEFSSFLYEDSNANVVSVTGNKLYIVKNQSNLKVTIPSVDKMIAKNSSTPARYEISCGNRSATVNYETGDVSVILGTISNAGNTDITVKAFDSRGLSVSKKVTVAIIDYVNIVQKNTFARLNNFENSTTLVTKGTFSLVNCGGVNKNTIQSVRYRYAKISDNYGADWLSLTPTITNNGYTASNVTLDLDNQNSWKIQVEIKDKFTTSTIELSVSEGIPILYVNSSRKNVGIGKQNTTGEAYSLALAGDLILKNNQILDNLLPRYFNHYDIDNKDNNLDNYLTQGLYQLGRMYQNAPITTNVYGVLIVITSRHLPWTSEDLSNWIWQFLLETNGNIYMRNAVNNTTWSNWKMINEDSGWKDLELSSNITVGSLKKKAQYRKIGKLVQIRGDVAGVTKSNTVVATLPDGYRPSLRFDSLQSISGVRYARYHVNTSGQIVLEWISDGNYNLTWHNIDMNFMID